MTALLIIVEKICYVLLWIFAILAIFFSLFVLPRAQIDPELDEKEVCKTIKKVCYIGRLFWLSYVVFHFILIPIFK